MYYSKELIFLIKSISNFTSTSMNERRINLYINEHFTKKFELFHLVVYSQNIHFRDFFNQIM